MNDCDKSVDQRTGISDEVLREVWRVKEELSASCGHNLDQLFAEAREHQRASGRASVTLEPRKRAETGCSGRV